MKPAPCSWRVRISLILVERDRLSRKSRFSSPGTPNTYSTPSSSRQWMNRSEALVIRARSARWNGHRMAAPGRADSPPNPSERKLYRALFRLSPTPCGPSLQLACTGPLPHSPRRLLWPKTGRHGGQMGGSRQVAIGLGVLGAAALFALFLLLRPLDAQAVQPTVSVAPGNYVSVATCGGTTCHGRSQGDGPHVRQDEIMLWQDPATPAGAHSRAYAVLREPRSRAIAERLGIGEATGAPMCLGCHATPAGPRGVRFQTTDGVGCESCHGPASGWLTSHYAVGGTHEANVRNGLVPLDTARARADRCLNCHFGSSTENQFVTHRIMAAGHPRISFELDLFTTLQQHYTADDDYRQRGKNLAAGTQVWATGQAMALERSLSLFVSARGTEGIFPEFYFFDCHSCHRQISDDPRFRPGAVANPGRPIPSGMPPYNDENMIMLSAAARVVSPG